MTQLYYYCADGDCMSHGYLVTTDCLWLKISFTFKLSFKVEITSVLSGIDDKPIIEKKRKQQLLLLFY